MRAQSCSLTNDPFTNRHMALTGQGVLRHLFCPASLWREIDVNSTWGFGVARAGVPEGTAASSLAATTSAREPRAALWVQSARKAT